MNRERKRSPRQLAHHAISRIEGEGAYTDIVLSHVLEHSRLPEKDRAFINELVRGVIRWKLYLDWIVGQLFTGNPNNMPHPVRWLLWMGMYQIEFLNVPEFAAVNESVQLCKSLKQFKWQGVVNGILRSYLRGSPKIRFPDAAQKPVLYLSVTTSHPEWLVQRWIHEFGVESTKQLCSANNATPILTVRPNLRRLSFDDFRNKLESHAVEFNVSTVPGFFRILSMPATLRHRLLSDGLMVVQDESAGLVGLLAQPQPGDTVLDLCAAPGGKSTHVATLCSDRCRVVSGDINIKRIRLLQNTIATLGLQHVHTIAADALHFPANSADVVLLDAPCSGLGVLQKKPDIRWKRQAHDIHELSKLQLRMLKHAAELVKEKGRLIYSTCTIEREENEAVIEQFIKQHPEFTIEHAANASIPQPFITKDGFIRTFPHLHGMDGSFAARLTKRW